MSSVDLGWKVSAGNLLPIMTDLQPAPQKFMEVVLCGASLPAILCAAPSAGVYVLILPITLILSLSRVPNLYWSACTVHCYNV